jgi:Tfp pilus assembly protein PilO
MMSSPKIHLALALVFLLLTAAGYGFWYSTIGAKSAESAVLSGEIETKHEDATRLKAAKLALTDVAKSEAVIDSHFVSTSDVVSYIEELQTTGSTLGTDVTIASVSADTDSAHPTLALSLQIDGSFANVVRTLGAIEYSPYYVTVQNLALLKNASTGAATSTTASWAATVSLTVGASKVPVAATPAPSPASSTPPTAAASMTAPVPAKQAAPKALPAASSTGITATPTT